MQENLIQRCRFQTASTHVHAGAMIANAVKPTLGDLGLLQLITVNQ